MNEDRVIGAGREMLGNAERGIGEATGSERLQGDGVADQVAGAVQHGYGKVKDAVAEVIDDTPSAIAGAVDQARSYGRHGNEAVRDRLGDNGPLYLVGGAIALFALGAFAFSRSSQANASTPRLTPKRRAAKPNPKPAKTAG